VQIILDDIASVVYTGEFLDMSGRYTYIKKNKEKCQDGEVVMLPSDLLFQYMSHVFKS